MNIKSEGITLYVDIDDDPIHPRKDCDNLGKMICWHRRYDLGDKNPYDSPQDFKEDTELQNDIFTKLNVFLLDHSGLWISATPFTAVDPQGWDSGQVGYIYATKTDVLREYGNLSYETQLQVNQTLIGEIENYNNYLTGNYFYFMIEDEEGEVVDTCGSFTGNSMTDILKAMKTVASLDYDFLFDKMIEKQSHADMY